MFTPKRISPDCPFKRNERQAPRCAVWCTPRSLSPQCEAHRRSWFGSVKHTAEFVKEIWSTWLCGVMHTAEIDYPVRCTPQSFFYNLWSLDSAVWCTPWSFLKISTISQRNWNRLGKYFSLFIRVLNVFESWKNAVRKSRNTLPLKGQCKEIFDHFFP